MIAGFSLLTAGAAVGLLDVAPSPSVVGAAAAGNGDYGASDSAVAGAAAYPVPPVVKLAGALHLEEEVAWHEGRTVRYYDLGTHSSLDGDTTAIADVWVFIDGFDNDGAPRFIPGHPALFDVVPGQEGLLRPVGRAFRDRTVGVRQQRHPLAGGASGERPGDRRRRDARGLPRLCRPDRR